MPQHRFDLVITDHYGPLITGALQAMLPTSALRRVVEHVASLVVKDAADPQQAFLRQAAQQALAAAAGSGGGGGGGMQQGDLESVLRQVYADAYGAGGAAAMEQLPGAATVSLAGVSEVDWSAWRPGHPAAANLLTNGGLQSLLDQADATVQGVQGTLLRQMGNRIAAGVAAGDSVDSIASGLGAYVADPDRAEMIAHTETARAMTAATLDTYAANGVGQWDWLLSPDACPECEEQRDANPHRPGDEQPPLHPRCRCAIAPVADATTGGDSGAGGDGGGSLLSDVADVAAGLASSVTADTAGAVAALPEDLTVMSEEDLAGLLTAQTDDGAIQRVLDELDRRDTEEQKAAASRARSQARRDRARAEKDARYEALVDGGADPQQAFADVFGVSVERQQVQQAMGSLRALGYKGRNLDELCRDFQKSQALEEVAKAEDATNGYLLSPAGKAAGVEPYSLWFGSESRARKFASEELRHFWQFESPRLTLADVKASLLGGGEHTMPTDWI